MSNFDAFFEALADEYRETNSLTEIRNSEYEIDWGEGYGVYTIWNRRVGLENLIYVGLTGKYTRDKNGDVTLNSGAFSGRKARYTPYRFCQSSKDPEDLRYTFRYGPKYSNSTVQGKHKHDRDAYRHTIPYKDLVIVILDVSQSKKHSPASLEAMILTEYLFETGDLPPANNEL